MRILLILCTFLTIFLGEVIPANKAFQITSASDFQSVFVRINVAKGIFLYKNQLKVLLNSDDITNLLNLPKFTQKDAEEVHYGALELNLPTHFLKSREIKRASLQIFYQGCSDEGFCYRPMSADFEIAAFNEGFKIEPLKKQKDKFTQTLENSHFVVILLVFFGYGILLSLTPCTLPMIPILSALILNQGSEKAEKSAPSKKRALFLSLIFVLFMSLAYAIAGIITASLGASVQGILQRPLILGAFAAILMLLALNCFGLFSLSLPQNLAKFKVKFKGVLGVAVMGFVSAFVVGPCVIAPLAAALLYIATTQDVILGGFALFTLSLGMGIPLIFISLGLGFLKAGAWTARVNFIFGFLLLGVAVWLLSRFLSSEISLILWGVLGVFFAIFMGLFEGENSNSAKIKKAFLMLILTLSLALFLSGICSIFGVKFSVNSGLNFSLNFGENLNSNAQNLDINLALNSRNLNENSSLNLNENLNSNTQNSGLNLGKNSASRENLKTQNSALNSSLNLNQNSALRGNLNTKNSTLNFKFSSDLNEIKAYLKAAQKPVMLYFTATWCENCKLLERLTFSDERVNSRLKNYDLIKIDISENSEANLAIMREFAVFAPPVIIFYHANTEFTRLIGFINAEKFIENLQ